MPPSYEISATRLSQKARSANHSGLVEKSWPLDFVDATSSHQIGIRK